MKWILILWVVVPGFYANHQPMPVYGFKTQASCEKALKQIIEKRSKDNKYGFNGICVQR